MADQANRYTLLVPPQLKDNGAPSGLTYLDTATPGEFKHLRVLIAIGTTDAATTAAPKLTESDTTNGTYTDITSAALSAAVAATADDTIHAIDVDLTYAHKRYIKCEITAGDGTTGTNLAVIGVLSRGDMHAGNATDSNITELISA